MIVRGRGVTLYTPHGYSFSSGSPNSGRMVVQRMVERMVAQRCDMVVAVSEAEGRLARDVIRARRVRVIPNGIPELDHPPDVAPRTGRPLVAAVGRIVAARSPAATARILAAVSDVADVTWIGQAPHDEDEPLRSLGVPITGWLEHGEAVARLARASVMVHWSAGDGASLAVLEAMAVGTAVVASDIPANRELLGDTQVAATEAEAIARVRRLLVDEPAHARMVGGQRCRAAARGAPDGRAAPRAVRRAPVRCDCRPDPSGRRQDVSRDVDLSDLAAAIWRRRWLVVAVVVCTTALAAGFALLRTSRYESSAVLAITPSTAATGGLLSSNDLNTLMGTYAQTAKSSAIRDRAAEALGRPLGAEIDTSVRSGTGILRITASATDPVVAADAARAVADAFAESLEANGSINASTIEPSRPATSPANPRVGLVVALGAGLGLFGGVVLALVVDRARPRLVDSTASPLSAPRSSAASPTSAASCAAPGDRGRRRWRRSATCAPSSPCAARRRARSWRWSGAVPGTGASTLAANLAVAFARIGIETVLVDADLRRPCQHVPLRARQRQRLVRRACRGGAEAAGHHGLEVARPHRRTDTAGADGLAACRRRGLHRWAPVNGSTGGRRLAADARRQRRSSGRPDRRRRGDGRRVRRRRRRRPDCTRSAGDHRRRADRHRAERRSQPAVMERRGADVATIALAALAVAVPLAWAAATQPLLVLVIPAAVGVALVLLHPTALLLGLVAVLPWEDALSSADSVITPLKVIALVLLAGWVLATAAGRPITPVGPAIVWAVGVGFAVGLSLLASPDLAIGLADASRYASFIVFAFLVVQLATTLGRVARRRAGARGVEHRRCDGGDRERGRVRRAPRWRPDRGPQRLRLPSGGGPAAGRLAADVRAAAGTAVGHLRRADADRRRGDVVAGRVRRHGGHRHLGRGDAAAPTPPVAPGRRDVRRGRRAGRGALANVPERPPRGEGPRRQRQRRSAPGLWRAALEMAGQRPLTGVGPGRFAELADRYLVEDPLGVEAPVAHSTYFHVLAELGVIGAVALVGMFVATLILLVRARSRAAARQRGLVDGAAGVAGRGPGHRRLPQRPPGEHVLAPRRAGHGYRRDHGATRRRHPPGAAGAAHLVST